MSRTSVEALVLKASRLARLVDAEETLVWLALERFGYSADDDVSIKYLGLTSRWISQKSGTAYWGPIGQQESLVAGLGHELEVITTR
jgi:hypothetical protein